MDRIKGLSIALDLDTLQLERGLTGLRDRMRTLNSEMRANLSSFDKADKSVGKYQTKLDSLNKKLEVQTRIVKEAKARYEEMVKEHGEGSKEAERAARTYNNQVAVLNRLQRQIEHTKQQIRELQQQQRISQSGWFKLGKTFDQIGGKLTNLGKGLSGVGQSLTDKITKPATAAASALVGITLVKGFDRLMGIDTARAKLSALGHDAKTIESIMDSALESVRGTAFGLDEAATTAANAVAAGIEPGKELTRYLKLTGDAAAISGSSLGEMGSIINKVTTAGKAYNGELQMLSDRGIPIYEWLAEEANTTADAIFDMASKGEISSEMLLDAIEKNIGGAAKTMGEKSFRAALTNIGADIARIGANFLDAGDKGKGFFSQVKPLLTDFREFLQSLEPHAAELGTKFGAFFAETVENIKNAINWYRELSPTMQSVVKNILLIGSALTITSGPLLMFTGRFLATIGNIMTATAPLMKRIAEAGGLMKWLGAGLKSFALGPVGITLGVLTGLSTAFILLYKNSETFRNGVQKVGTILKATFAMFKGDWEGARDMLSAIGMDEESIVKIENYVIKIQRAFHAVVEFVKQKFSEIKQFWDKNSGDIRDALENIGKIVERVFKTIVSVIEFFLPIAFEIVKTVWENIKGVVSGALDVIMGIIQFFAGLFTLNFSKMWEGIKNIFSGALQFIWNFIQLMFWGRILSGLKSLTQLIIGLFRNGWTTIKNVFSTVLQWIVNFVRNRFTAMKDGISKVMTGIKNIISAIWNGILNFFKTVIQAIVNFVRSRFTNLKETVKSIFSAIRELTKTIWNAIKENAVNPVRNAVNTIRQRFTDLKDRISSIFKNIKDTVSKRVSEMVETVKGMPKRMGDGLKKTAGKISDGVKEVANRMVKTLGKGVNGVISGVNWVLDKLKVPKKHRLSKWQVPQYAHGTDGHPGGPAIVGDGKGTNAGSELIITPDGNQYLSPDKPTLINLPAGTHVIPAKITKEIIPHYAWGTIKKATSSVWGSVKKGAKNIKDAVVDIWMYIDEPKKLLNKVLEALGISPPSGKNWIAQMAKAAFNKVKDAAVNFLKKRIDEFFSFDAGPNANKNVKSWIAKAIAITGVPGSWLKPLVTIAMHESGGNPRAINLWDINAKRGTPSKGLMQTIDPTFNAYKLPGLDNIWNPIHNAVAAIRYIIARYGTVFNVPGIRSLARGGRYRGYKTGGRVVSPGLYWLAEEGWPEYVIPTNPARRTEAMKLLALAGKEIAGNKRPNQLSSISFNDSGDINELIKLMKEFIDKASKITEINQYITINSPQPTSPAENARKMKQASRQLALEWGGR